MKEQIKKSSLFFEEKQHLTHFATEQDVAEELFELLSEARELYLQNVITNGKRYSRYVDDFINSHRYINCDNAVCQNCHEMNIHIVKNALTLSNLFLQHQISRSKNVWSCEDGMIGWSRCRHRLHIVLIR